jgi:hypothetical protein
MSKCNVGLNVSGKKFGLTLPSSSILTSQAMAIRSEYCNPSPTIEASFLRNTAVGNRA